MTLPPNVAMPPKTAIPKSVAFVPHGLHETMEERRRRLRPDLFAGDTASTSPVSSAEAPNPARVPAAVAFGGIRPAAVATPASGFGGPRPVASTTRPAESGLALVKQTLKGNSSSKTPAPSHCTRSDAPVVRNLRRGSAAEAVASLHRLGAAALEADLRQGKVAKTSAAPATSVWKTWQGYHYDVFGDELDPLPITPQKLVSVGSLSSRRAATGLSPTTPPERRTRTLRLGANGASCWSTRAPGLPGVC